MVIYVVIFGILMALGILVHFFASSKKPVIIYCAVAWLLLTVLAAVRWSVGIDYNQYYNIFFKIRRVLGWAETFELHYEPGFLLLTKAVSCFTRNVIVYLFIVYGLIYGLMIYYIYKYSEVKWASFAAFFAFDYFAMSYCFMRQAIAMAIGLFVFEKLKEKKIGLAFLLSLVAAMFHLSALVLVLCILVSLIGPEKRRLFKIYVIFSIIIAVSCDYILEYVFVGPFAKYAGYMESQFMGKSHILFVYYPITMFAFVICFYKQLHSVDEKLSRLIPVLFLGTVLCFMSTRHYLFERFALYITFYNIRIVPQLLSTIRTRLSRDVFYVSVYITIIISISAYSFALINDRYGIYPYRVNKIYLEQIPMFENIN